MDLNACCSSGQIHLEGKTAKGHQLKKGVSDAVPHSTAVCTGCGGAAGPFTLHSTLSPMTEESSGNKMLSGQMTEYGVSG